MAENQVMKKNLGYHALYVIAFWHEIYKQEPASTGTIGPRPTSRLHCKPKPSMVPGRDVWRQN